MALWTGRQKIIQGSYNFKRNIQRLSVRFQDRRGQLRLILLSFVFQVQEVTRLLNSPNPNNTMVARGQYGRWESFWWICYHLISEHLNIHVMLLPCHQGSQRSSHQVIPSLYTNPTFGRQLILAN